MGKLRVLEGTDNFRELREGGYFYVDKSLLVQEFLELNFKATLITRPRRFGKTLNMTMLQEFFDVTKDSRALFQGLAIMDTECAEQLNKRPVVYLTLKSCRGGSEKELLAGFNDCLYEVFRDYAKIFKGKVDAQDDDFVRFYQLLTKFRDAIADYTEVAKSLLVLITAVSTFFKQPVLLMIDEYDMPIVCSHECGYHDKLRNFFTNFFGLVLKGNVNVWRSLLTGVQRVSKESIFSGVNNLKVCTVLDDEYSTRFGLTEGETANVLQAFGLELNEEVKKQYDGYRFGSTDIYNPLSVLSYASSGKRMNYWVNTSSNTLIYEAVKQAEADFRRDFDKLLQAGEAEVPVDLQTSFMELSRVDCLWGLFVNAGYLTVIDGGKRAWELSDVRIPNGEVRSEFIKIVEQIYRFPSGHLHPMFHALVAGDVTGFLSHYSRIVELHTSSFDSKESFYHALFLGMCIVAADYAPGQYLVTSNLEAGHGRYDVCVKALAKDKMNILIEFKQGDDLEKLKEAALKQIFEKEYYAGLHGRVLCIGLAHDKKRCEAVHELIKVDEAGGVVRALEH